jgi:hypothetical protein
MIRRLLVGIFIGLLMGGLVAAGLVAGLHVVKFEGAGGVALAYLSAAALGVLTGLFAGKPIWAANARLEAGLKAFFGAMLAAGGMFALRQWGASWMLPEALGQLGHGAVADLPTTSLPLIASALGALFELDNTGDGDASAKKSPGAAAGPRKRVAAQGDNGKAGAARRPAADDEAGGEADVASRGAKR